MAARKRSLTLGRQESRPSQSATRKSPLPIGDKEVAGVRSGGGAASVADEEFPEHVERSLETSHALFEPAHAVAEIPDSGIHVVA